MFSLWGSSTSKSSKSSKSNQSTASLPDLDALQKNEEKFDTYSHSSALLPTFNNVSLHRTSEPIMDVILDKDNKHKLSVSANLSFLFDKKTVQSAAVSAHRYLSRYPYYIVSNQNVNFISKLEHEHKLKTTTVASPPPLQPLPAPPMTAAAVDCCDEAEQKVSPSSETPYMSEVVTIHDLDQWLDSMNLSTEEKKGVLSLCEWIKTEKMSPKLCHEMWMVDVVTSYFSSLSPTNPDLHCCYKRWIQYRHDNSLIGENINAAKLKQFFDTGIFSIGFDNERRPVWFINTEFYDESFGVDIITKACVLWVSSLQFDIAKNEFDTFCLRRGLSVYVNLSHWSINMCSWNVVQAVKKAVVAYPYWLVDIYVANIPTFMYLLKQLAAKVLVPHAMQKFKVLADSNEYFEKYASKHKTPICAGGTLKVHPSQWVIDRGFLHYVEPASKHCKSPSAPVITALDL